MAMSHPSTLTPESIRQGIRVRAQQAGFDVVGFAQPTLSPRDQTRMDVFATHGEAGDMGWIAETLERRRDPKELWPEVRTVIVLAMNYGPEDDPMPRIADRGLANISCYAQNRDYHDLVKKRLKQVGHWLGETYGEALKVFVDTAPIMEKPLGAYAGLGWQGKHTNLVSRAFGSWLFLGEIFTSLDIAPPAQTPQDHCGNCQRCLDICPTKAFPTPYTLDARRCLSYLSIEHKGAIPVAFRQAMGNRIYGCDDCLAVCPWNKFATRTDQAWFQPRPDLESPRLADFLTFDDAQFRAHFKGSPIKRIGRDRFLRNVLIAVGNSGDPALESACASLLEDPAPIVRGAAIWALGQLAPAIAAQLAASFLPEEQDPHVQAEWQMVQS